VTPARRDRSRRRGTSDTGPRSRPVTGPDRSTIEEELAALVDRARGEGVSLDDDRIGPLADLVEAIVSWSSRVNLVSRRELPVLVSKHVAPSLLPLIGRDPGSPCTLVDVGSGGGLPGLVIAIARPGWTVTLVEPLRRKTLFLESRVPACPGVRVLRMRAEEVPAGDPRLDAGADVVTARAVAPPHEIWPLARPLLAPGGELLVYVAGDAHEEAARELRDRFPGVGVAEPIRASFTRSALLRIVHAG